jgi:hypothetical protein
MEDDLNFEEYMDNEFNNDFEEYINEFGEFSTPYNSREKRWMCNRGTEIALEELTLDHLKNVIGWLNKHNLEVHQDILDELKKRKKKINRSK